MVCVYQEIHPFLLGFHFGGVQIFKVFPYDSLDFLGVYCMFPIFSLILLLILIFSVCALVNLIKDLSILLIFLKGQTLHSIHFLYCFYFVDYSPEFMSTVYSSTSSLKQYSFCSNAFRCAAKLLI